MTDSRKINFDTTILQLGNNTGVCVPDDVVEKLGAGKKPPVHLTINNYTYRSSIAVMGGRFMIGVSAAIRGETGIKGGDKVHVAIEPDLLPREVAIPADFHEMLNKNAKAKQFFESLSYSNKQRYVLPIGQAKTTETRQRRMEKAITDLNAERK